MKDYILRLTLVLQTIKEERNMELALEEKRKELAKIYSPRWANNLSEAQVGAIWRDRIERLRKQQNPTKKEEFHQMTIAESLYLQRDWKPEGVEEHEGTDCAAGGGYHQMTIWEVLK
jgi:hypothetical protein